MKYAISFVLYLIFAAVHLFACKKDRQPLRKITKIFLMPSLCLAYYLCGGNSIFIFFGLVFCLAGDFILIRANEYTYRMSGATSFAMGHLFFLFFIIKKFHTGDYAYWMIPVLIIYIGIAIFAFMRLRVNIDKSMRISCLAYLLLLGFMTATGFCRGIIDIMQGSCSGLFIFTGYVLFFLSDSLLIHQWFTVKDPYPAMDFKVMLTYILAQLMLCIGFIVGTL